MGIGMVAVACYFAPPFFHKDPATSSATAAPIAESYDATYQEPARPITLGGYREIRNGWTASYDFQMAQEQAKYLRDKAELERDIATCRFGNPTCHPRVKDFADMLDQVADIDDQLQQVKIVNAWVNMIPFDDDEVKTAETNLDHHSLSEALILNRAVCDESARLKLFALEVLKFNRDDIRWVAEAYYIGTEQQHSGHDVTEVRIGNDIWIMNITVPRIESGNITLENAATIINDGSRIESDASQLNFSGNSIWGGNGRFIPSFGFNSSMRFLYNSNRTEHSLGEIPAVAQHAEVKRDWLGSAAETSQVMSIMASAFAPNYTIDGHAPAHAVTLRSNMGQWGHKLIHQFAKHIF